MLKKDIDYAQLADSEWVKILTSTPVDEVAHRYFFGTKCRPMLQYIANSLFENKETELLLGEFYILLSQNNWYVIRQFKSLNGASLNSYLTRCSIHHFIKKKKQESPLQHNAIPIETPDICNELNRFTTEEENDNPPVWQAFEQLKERDRIILRYLVIEGKSALEAAEKVWPLIKTTEKDWKKLPVKRVQDTIAILKRRALLALATELQQLIKKGKRG